MDITSNNSYNERNKEKILQNNIVTNLKNSGNWEISPITINGASWEFLSSTYEWCSGNGTWQNPYIIENVTIKDQESSDYCIGISDSNVFFKIINCEFYNNTHSGHESVILNNVKNGYFINNSFSLNWRAMNLDTCNNITIQSNTFNTDITKETALFFSLQDCIRLEFSGNITIIENDIQKTPIGILSANSQENIFSKNIIKYGSYGIELIKSNINTISENIIEYNTATGLSLYLSNLTIISNNLIENNAAGLRVDGCSKDTFLSNIISNNSYTGFTQLNSNDIIIHNNNITSHNNWGIYFKSNNNSTIKENLISHNSYGISTWSCNNTMVYGNTVIHNDDRGINILGDNNTILFNNFSYNGYNPGGNNVGSYGLNNKWDNGTIGNYYSDYEGKDTNDDNIGDTPRIIGDSTDNFPIWWDPPVIIIRQPVIDQSFGKNSPEFNISIAEGIVDAIWYSISNGTNILITELNGSIDQQLWDSSNYGVITITFYANDSLGVIGFSKVVVKKTQTTTISGYSLLLLNSIFWITLIIFFKKHQKSHFNHNEE